MLEKETLGWKEWVSLPIFGIPCILAKIDTGARTSSLHTIDEEVFIKDNMEWVRFTIALDSRENITVSAEAPLIARRIVTNSGGQAEERFVIEAQLRIGDWCSLAEVTLARRRGMKCRMLIGRTAMSGTTIVDPEHAFLHQTPLCDQNQ
ncbi:MAG: ATP-dependent zinc protease [Halodesulfovibrio sp.]|uniref:ATP-dependent zinc protease family protein n=1 Tax=Halodesulfovibrio sp. TaxID=1912772 RepID=UPI00359E75E6